MSDQGPGRSCSCCVVLLTGPAAMEWLSRVFGFEMHERWLDDDGILTHGEMSTGDGLIMLATPSPDYEGPALHRATATLRQRGHPCLGLSMGCSCMSVTWPLPSRSQAGAPLLC